MILSIKNKNIGKIIDRSSLSDDEKNEIKSDFSMLINHIDRMSKEQLEELVISSISKDFLSKWKK